MKRAGGMRAWGVRRVQRGSGGVRSHACVACTHGRARTCVCVCAIPAIPAIPACLQCVHWLSVTHAVHACNQCMCTLVIRDACSGCACGWMVGWLWLIDLVGLGGGWLVGCWWMVGHGSRRVRPTVPGQAYVCFRDRVACADLKVIPSM